MIFGGWGRLSTLRAGLTETLPEEKEHNKDMKKNVGLLMYLLGAMVLWLLIPATAHAESAKELYCLFNPVSGEYLYTVDENEKASLESAWYLEGVVGKLPSESSMPIYRLYNPVSGLHLYTADPAEISKLTGEGWTNENVAFYVAEENAAPIYRLFDPKTGEHAFGSDATAAKMEQNGWTREGVAFYATWANNDLIYTGKKTGAGTTTATNAITATNGGAVINAPGKWYDGFQRNVWYDADFYFFCIVDVDDYETNKPIVFSPVNTAYYEEILPSRYPDRYANPRFLSAKEAGGVPIVMAESSAWNSKENCLVQDRKQELLWTKNSTADRSKIKVDQTFAPIGTDSPWGELYVVHGNGLGAYYYSVDNNNRVENDKLCWDNDNYHFREKAATEALWDNLYEACGGFQNYAATLANKVYVNMERIGTWNGLSINRVFFEQWTDTNPRPW